VTPLVIIVPLFLVLGGVLMFVLLPLELWLRVLILLSELMAAVVVGLILKRRGHG
jgi:hypothetical protein